MPYKSEYFLQKRPIFVRSLLRRTNHSHPIGIWIRKVSSRYGGNSICAAIAKNSKRSACNRKKGRRTKKLSKSSWAVTAVIVGNSKWASCNKRGVRCSVCTMDKGGYMNASCRIECHMDECVTQNESWLMYEWVMSHMWMSHVTRVNESCHTFEWVMSHMWMSHVTHMNEACHTHGWVMSHEWMNHVSHMNESCHTREWFISRMWMRQVTWIHESFHTNEELSNFRIPGIPTISFQ